MATRKRDSAQHSSRVAELEGQLREGNEERGKLTEEKKRESAALQGEINKLKKEMSDSKVWRSLQMKPT